MNIGRIATLVSQIYILFHLYLKIHRVTYSCVRVPLIQFLLFFNSVLSYWDLGNRWIQPLWTVLPHKTPPLDLSELEPGRIKYPQVRHEIIQYHDPESQGGTPQPQEYMEMQKRESEI